MHCLNIITCIVHDNEDDVYYASQDDASGDEEEDSEDESTWLMYMLASWMIWCYRSV